VVDVKLATTRRVFTARETTMSIAMRVFAGLLLESMIEVLVMAYGLCLALLAILGGFYLLLGLHQLAVWIWR
jgi:hypothetical protein